MKWIAGLRAAGQVWLVLACLGVLAAAVTWWRSAERMPADLLSRVVLVAGLAALAAAAAGIVTAWWQHRRGERDLVELRLAEAVLQVIDPPAKGMPLRVRAWSGKQPQKIEVRWGRGWSADAPAARHRLETQLAESVAGEWSGSYKPRARRVVLTRRDRTAVETSRAQVAARTEAIVRKAVAGARSVRVIEWAMDARSEGSNR